MDTTVAQLMDNNVMYVESIDHFSGPGRAISPLRVYACVDLCPDNNF